nr:transporter substrate-binding domain-containing protein [Zooshikella harenae]
MGHFGRILLFLISCQLSLMSKGAGSFSSITIPRPQHQPSGDLDTRSDYFSSLLDKVLLITNDRYDPIKLTYHPTFFTQARTVRLLANGEELDVIWLMTDIQRETRLRPIRTPLMKGLLGVRCLVIRQSDKKRFESIKSIESLRKLLALQGHDWPDTKILRANYLLVLPVRHYHEAFSMLAKGRADYFPRGILEALPELESKKELSLTVANHLLITYRAPIYYFVNKQNSKLAERIELGLKRLIATKALDKHLKNYHGFELVNKLMKNHKTKLLKLYNPLLTTESQNVSHVYYYQDDLFKQ